MNLAPEYDPARGIIRLPRAHLEAMVAGDHRVLDPHDQRGALLARLGLTSDGRLDPALRRLLAVLRRPGHRFGLRVESADANTRHRGWIAGAGVVTVTGGLEPADVLDVRHAPRPEAAARVVARLAGLGPARAVTELPGEPLSWTAVTAAVRDRSGSAWAAAAFGARAPVRLIHLRWSTDGVGPAHTVMVLLSADGAGLVEVVHSGDTCRLTPRRPVDVWTGLCALTSRR